MSDNRAAPDDDENDGSLHIKSVKGIHKRRARAAARRAGVTAGELFGRMLDAYEEKERGQAFGDVLSPEIDQHGVRLMDPPPPMTVAELDVAYSLAVRIAEDEGRPLSKHDGRSMLGRVAKGVKRGLDRRVNGEMRALTDATPHQRSEAEPRIVDTQT